MAEELHVGCALPFHAAGVVDGVTYVQCVTAALEGKCLGYSYPIGIGIGQRNVQFSLSIRKPVFAGCTRIDGRNG